MVRNLQAIVFSKSPLVSLVASVLISFGPLAIYNVLLALKMLTSIPFDQCEAIDKFICALPWLSPVLNPLIYSFSGSNFRQHVASLFGMALSPDLKRIIQRSPVHSSMSITPSKLSISIKRLSIDSTKSQGKLCTAQTTSLTSLQSTTLLLPCSPPR